MNKHIEEERGNICKERGPHTSLRIPNYYGITSMVTFSILKEGNKKKGDDKTRTILKKKPNFNDTTITPTSNRY